MPKEKTVRKSQRRIRNEEFAELCEESTSLIQIIEGALVSTRLMEHEDKTINAFQWLNKCNKHLGILKKVLRTLSLSTSEKQRCMNLIHQIEYLHCHFDILLKRGEGVRRPNDSVRWLDSDVAFNRRLHTGVIVNIDHKDINAFLDDAFVLFEERIRKSLNRYGPLKVYTVFAAKFRRMFKDGKEQIELKTFTTESKEIFPTTLLDDWYNNYVKQPTLINVEEFEEQDSDWKLDDIHRLVVNVNKYNPMRACSYIDLPASIKRKKACVNVQNTDNQCFKWAVLSALYPTEQDSKRVSKYRQYEEVLDFTGIEFPVALTDIPKFEVKNDISINVYGLLRKNYKFSVSPLCITSQKRERHINLLRIEDHYIDENLSEEEDDNDDLIITPFNYHYVWIKDLSRLVAAQLSKNHYKKLICDRCLHYFTDKSKLLIHDENCKIMNHTRIILPEYNKNNIVTFKNFKNKEKAPFIVYADCESLLIPVDETEETKSNTNVIQNHTILSVGYYLKCSYDDSLCV